MNDERPYDVFFHVTPVSAISQIRFSGQAIVSYIGIGKGIMNTSKKISSKNVFKICIFNLTLHLLST